jgi:hypothetical protein
MGLPVARSKMRGRVAVLGAVALVLTAVALTRSVGADAHEVVTPYPLTCSMVGLSPTFTTNHAPEAGTTPGGALTLHVHVATPATGMAMNTRTVKFTLPKPALTDRITGVTFKTGGNFAGSATVSAAGLMSFTFTGNAMSNAITLPDFDIASVTKTTAMAGEKVSWLGPSQVLLDDGATDTCTPASGAAIQFAPTVVLDPGCMPSTTMGGHDDHDDHGGDDHSMPPCTTATTATTRATTATTMATTATTRATTATTRATTATTRATTATTRATTATTARPITTTTMRPGGILAFFRQLLCRVFRICPPA